MKIKEKIREAVKKTLEDITDCSRRKHFETYTIQKEDARVIIKRNFEDLIK